MQPAMTKEMDDILQGLHDHRERIIAHIAGVAIDSPETRRSFASLAEVQSEIELLNRIRDDPRPPRALPGSD